MAPPLDFPSSPTNGQVFVGGNGVTYTWNGTIWLAASMASQASDTPPANPQTNQLWFNSTLGQLFIYYTDANSSQWVPANPTPSGVPVGGGIIREVTLASPAATIDLFSLGVKSCKLLFKLQAVNSGVECYLRIVNGSTPVTASTYASLMLYNGHTTPATFNGFFVPADPAFRLAAGVGNAATHWIMGEATFPDLPLRRQGTAMVNYHQPTGAFLNGWISFIGDTAAIGGDGLQISFNSGNIAAGSFVRVIGWP